VTPNEHDEQTAARESGDERVDGLANGAAASAAAVPSSEADDSGEGQFADGESAEDAQFTSYLNAGANPFSSVHPLSPGVFPRLAPREFPRDEPSVGVPTMEQLPDPNALPEPGYPVMAGYQQTLPPTASAFPPAPSAFPAEATAFPPSAYAESPYSPQDDPYAAPRSPEAAPPLAAPGARPGATPHSGVRSPARPEVAPPLTPPSDGDASAFAPPAAQPPTAQPPVAPHTPHTSRPSVPGVPEVPGAAAPPIEPPPIALVDPPSLAEPVGPPPRETADSLTTDSLLHGKRPQPAAGWRRTLYRASGGLVRVGDSAANLRRRDLINRVRTPVAGGHHRVAVMSLKGGVGKTTTAVGLGATLASLRGDRVIAMDANPDRGTLSDKVRLETSATVRDLLNERAQVTRYADVRAFTSQASSRLEILASDRDPGVSVAFSADDYRAVSRVLEHYYSICITDCGTGLLHSAMSGILELADHIVLVSSPSVDGARSASATLDWLEAHDYAGLVRNAVVVLSTIRPRSKSTVDLDRLEQHFAARCRAVIRIPYDPHLEEGAEVELEMLSSETVDAYLQLAAIVGDGFAVPRRPVTHITSAAPLS
jgi:MinD-like ATPase involved in chromosome partitioning or flagellar assembly